MTHAEQQLLNLLGRALFGRRVTLPPDTDWQALLQEARSQSVHLLIYDCLTAQERASIPPETAALWQQLALSTMWQNEQLLHEQAAVLEALDGMSYVILKGSSSAMYYPRPELRCAGDIDLLLAPNDLDRAEAILIDRGYQPPNEDHPFHRCMHRGPFVVELHFEPPGIPSGDPGTALRTYFQPALAQAMQRNGLPILSDAHQAVLLILHKLEHITSSGLGLRQLCDWAVFVHERMSDALWRKLEPSLSRFGLLYFTQVITRICVDFLSLPEEKAPWCMTASPELCRALLEDLLRTGNFGSKEQRYGQRLFTSGQTEGRLSSLFHTGLETCHTHWPVCARHPILLPAAPFVLILRHRKHRKAGTRPAFHPLASYQSAKDRQTLYRSLRPFLPEDHSNISH